MAGRGSEPDDEAITKEEMQGEAVPPAKKRCNACEPGFSHPFLRHHCAQS